MIGAFTGDSVSFFIGQRWGRPLIEHWEPVRRRVGPAFDKAIEQLGERGGRYVVIGRFVGGLRAVVPLVAGASKMRYRQFAPWNAAASLAWVSVIVTVGAVFGEVATSQVDRVGTVVTVIVIVGLVAWWVRRGRH